jgi:hypothetical protein
MIEDASIVTAGISQGIAQDPHTIEGSAEVNALGESNRVGRNPSRVECHRSERVAEDVPQENGLGTTFSLACGIRDSSGTFELIARRSAGILWKLFREKQRLPGSDPSGPYTCFDGRTSGINWRLQ